MSYKGTVNTTERAAKLKERNKAIVEMYKAKYNNSFTIIAEHFKISRNAVAGVIYRYNNHDS